MYRVYQLQRFGDGRMVGDIEDWNIDKEKTDDIAAFKDSLKLVIIVEIMQFAMQFKTILLIAFYRTSIGRHDPT